jgi:hypothetical protein
VFKSRQVPMMMLLVSLLLLLSACGSEAPPAAPQAPTEAATEAPAPTEAASEATEAVTTTEEMTATETVTASEEMTGAEEMTSTEEMTATEEVTDAEEMTATEGMTGAEELTGTDAMTDTAVTTATAGSAAQGEVVAEGLNGPMGVLVGSDGSIWVIDSGVGGEDALPFINPQTGEPVTATFGLTARIVQITAEGEQQEVVSLPSVGIGMEIIGGARLAELDGVLYATVGQWLGDPEGEAAEQMAVVVAIEDGEITPVANTWDFERTNNPDGLVADSHPYGLAAGPEGTLLVADAAGNDLLQVDPTSGEITLLALFEGLPSPLPNPERGDAMEAAPVPTGIVAGEDGTIYVSFLSGFPFVPGSAKVVQVSADGEVSDYATGLTTLTDLTLGPDGALYAVQFGLFTEQGPQPNTGAIVRVEQGEASTPVIEALPFPTSIDFDAEGNAYVTINGVGAPGSGQVVKFTGVAAE